MKARESERLEHILLVTKLAERIAELELELSASRAKITSLKKKLKRRRAIGQCR